MYKVRKHFSNRPLLDDVEFKSCLLLWIMLRSICQSGVVNKEVLIANSVTHSDDPLFWSWNWNRSLFVWKDEQMADLAEEFLAQGLQPVAQILRGGTRMKEMDALWHQLTSIYLLEHNKLDLNLQNPPLLSSKFWESKAPSKVLVFSWRLLQHKLPCDQLYKRGYRFKTWIPHVTSAIKAWKTWNICFYHAPKYRRFGIMFVGGWEWMCSYRKISRNFTINLVYSTEEGGTTNGDILCDTQPVGV